MHGLIRSTTIAFALSTDEYVLYLPKIYVKFNNISVAAGIGEAGKLPDFGEQEHNLPKRRNRY